MNNSQKTIYLIAVIAIIILIANGVYSTRFFNGKLLAKNVLISLNTEDAHGVSIVQDSSLVSFESGYVYNLDISNFPNPDNSTISVAIPIRHLNPNTQYNCRFQFKMETNSPLPITVKTNSGITNEQTSFDADVEFPPVTINQGDHEYLIDLNFDTNEDGTGYVILDFKIDDTISNLNVKLSNVLFTEFKETTNANIDTEQASEAPLEIIQT